MRREGQKRDKSSLLRYLSVRPEKGGKKGISFPESSPSPPIRHKMRRIPSFSCLLLLSLSLLFLLSSCSGSESLEADPEAAKVAPVDEDKSLDVTPDAPTTSSPNNTSTTATSVPSEQTQTEYPDTASPESTADTNTPVPDFETKFVPLSESRSSPDEGPQVSSSASPLPPAGSAVINETRFPDEAVSNATTQSYNASSTTSTVNISEQPTTVIDHATSEVRANEVTGETTTPTSSVSLTSTAGSQETDSVITSEQSNTPSNMSRNESSNTGASHVSENLRSVNTTTEQSSAVNETSTIASNESASDETPDSSLVNNTLSTTAPATGPQNFTQSLSTTTTPTDTSDDASSPHTMSASLNSSTTTADFNSTSEQMTANATEDRNTAIPLASLPSTTEDLSGHNTSQTFSNASLSGETTPALLGNVSESMTSTQLVSETSTSPVVTITTTIIPEPDPWQDFKIEYCSLPHSRGPCKNDDIMWWYDHKDGVCKVFYFSGCGGNNNRFTSRKDCEMKCWNSQDICKLNRVRGPCTASFIQWYYDASIDQCIPFSYSGCLGNANRFSQKESCETQCKISNPPASVIPFPTPAIDDYPSSVSIPNALPHHNHISNGAVSCLEPKDPGKCRDYVTQYYYDSNENMCRSFVYTGCGGNSNRFTSRLQCESKCVHQGKEEPLSPVDKDIVCRLEADPGSGTETHARWVYDPNSFTCLPFVYTGSGGNRNRFKSFEICLKFCRVPSSIMNPFVPSVDTQSAEEMEESRSKASGRLPGPFPYPEMTSPSTTTPLSTTTQKDICKYECMDSPYFADCNLIVLNQFCHNPYYAKFCCKSCVQNNQLDVNKVKEVLIGPENSNYNIMAEGARICLFENTL